MTTTTTKEWRETTLDTEINLLSGGTPKTSVKDYWDGDIPWLSVADFNNPSRWVRKAEKSITDSGLQNSATTLLEPGDLIISARGTVGALAQVKNKMAFNQSCYGIRAKDTTTNDFLYYLIKSKLKEVQRKVHGAVFDTITRETFHHIEVAMPGIDEQQMITAALSVLDEKIDLLEQQNETLEQVAQAIFNEKFVKAEEELPAGWKMGGLPDIANFLNGIALQKYPAKKGEDSFPAIKIRELKSGVTSATDRVSKEIPSQYIIHDGDVLFSWSGSLEVLIWQYGDGALNQHLFKVSSEKYPKWFYYFWLLHHLSDFRAIAANKATTMGHIQRYHLDEARVTIPDDATMIELDTLMAPILDKVILNNSQVQKLALLRDSLLPKLVNGEVRVKN